MTLPIWFPGAVDVGGDIGVTVMPDTPWTPIATPEQNGTYVIVEPPPVYAPPVGVTNLTGAWATAPGTSPITPPIIPPPTGVAAIDAAVIKTMLPNPIDRAAALPIDSILPKPPWNPETPFTPSPENPVTIIDALPTIPAPTLPWLPQPSPGDPTSPTAQFPWLLLLLILAMSRRR